MTTQLAQLSYPATMLDAYRQGYDNPDAGNPYLATSDYSDAFIIGQRDGSYLGEVRPAVGIRRGRGHTIRVTRDYGTGVKESWSVRVEGQLVVSATRHETGGAA
jgi:hypothetical protein